VDSGQYILGSQCREFEKEFAQFIGVKHAILTASGTSAIFLCLKALGVGEGDGILVPSLTAFPTVEPIFHVGATPIFVDIDETFTIDPKHIKEILNRGKDSGVRIKGIIPVHLYGHPADMDLVLELASQSQLFVIEDCCQAHGARYKGKRVGSIGVAGCFSFYPSKNLTVFGDGGMIVTSDDKISEVCRMLRDHGRRQKYEHELVGYNLRFNEIQAIIGRLQLQKLESFNESRRTIASWYSEGLKGTPVILPEVKDWAKPVFHLYVIQTQERDLLLEYLKEHGIQTGIHYPVPCHLQPAVRNLIDEQPKLERTEEVAKRILSLPMFPMLKKEEVEYVCSKVKEYFKR
jgi:dTDP-4-amino-4,6-dideoxygalactose transaminase